MAQRFTRALSSRAIGRAACMGLRLWLALASLSAAQAASGACGWNGATYAPRPERPASDIGYRLTTLPPPRDALAFVGERWRFELFARRGGQRLSRIELDYVCGMGRAPCAVWPTGKNDEDSAFHSVVTELNADFSPARGSEAPYAIVFANFGENDWTTVLTTRRVPGVRYFTRTRVPPDLSEQTVWVRTGCGSPG